MRIVSANVNGIRSATTKGFLEWLSRSSSDIVCLQEIKAQLEDIPLVAKELAGYTPYFFPAEKKGYAGVGIYSKHPAQKVQYGFGNPQFDAQGRYLQVDFANFRVVNMYFPSGSASADKQADKFLFLQVIFPILEKLLQDPLPCVLCGDWNMAHTKDDLKNWQGNQKNSGFLPEERAWLSSVYALGWVDVYRHLYPLATGEGYTWWSNRGQAYANNVGWRIDLQVASHAMAQGAQSASVFKDQKFSDHAPLVIDYAQAFF
ncbi:MAG: exodeoxyribonuclease III [Gammaproteobacteria bacterium]|nr:exodeoxyribonuclease III [Gammaproteobacteria bacterium]